MVALVIEDVTAPEDADMGDRVLECHDPKRGGRCRVRLYSPKGTIDDLAHANEIAIGHFAAKARAEANAI